MYRVLCRSDVLLLRWIEDHPTEWERLRGKEKEGLLKPDHDLNVLGYVKALLESLLDRPVNLCQIFGLTTGAWTPPHPGLSESLLSRYFRFNQFTEFHLDSCLDDSNRTVLPREIFRCKTVRHLSLKSNNLCRIPPDIGRLQNLEYLALTNNRLRLKSIPYTLVFCTNLKTLLLDYNRLDALPGFLLEMTSLKTVHRIGQHTHDFGAAYCVTMTSMPAHHCAAHRIVLDSGVQEYTPGTSLAFWAAKAAIASKTNFLSDDAVPSVLKDFICDIYEQFNVCQECTTASLINHAGFDVISFQSSYLGNTCVPFDHWVCSLTCASSVKASPRSDERTRRQLQQAFDMTPRPQNMFTFRCNAKKCTLI